MDDDDDIVILSDSDCIDDTNNRDQSYPKSYLGSHEHDLDTENRTAGKLMVQSEEGNNLNADYLNSEKSTSTSIALTSLPTVCPQTNACDSTSSKDGPSASAKDTMSNLVIDNIKSLKDEDTTECDDDDCMIVDQDEETKTDSCVEISDAESEDSCPPVTIEWNGDLDDEVAFEGEAVIEIELPGESTNDLTPGAFTHMTSLDSQNERKLCTTHDDTQMFFCKTCKATFPNLSMLVGHQIISLHPMDEPSACYCGQEFTFITDLQKHVLQHVVSEPFQCPLCGKRFFSVDNLSTHIDAHIICLGRMYQVSLFKCFRCMAVLATQDLLTSHMCEHAKTSILCVWCAAQFNSKVELLSHIVQVHKPKSEEPLSSINSPVDDALNYVCVECGSKHLNEDDAITHIINHHRNWAFQNVTQLLSLLLSSNFTPGKDLVICYNTFLSDFLDKVLPKGNFTTMKSHQVGMKNSSDTLLNVKKIASTKVPVVKQKSYKCSSTSDISGKPSDIHPSRKSKVPGKKFECSVCFIKFRQRGILENHMNTHTGARPFKCNICEKSFTQKVSLDQHMWIHSEFSPYYCGICSIDYIYHRNLLIHAKKHKDGMLFGCGFCRTTFSSDNLLLAHKRKYQKKLNRCVDNFSIMKPIVSHPVQPDANTVQKEDHDIDSKKTNVKLKKNQKEKQLRLKAKSTLQQDNGVSKKKGFKKRRKYQLKMVFPTKAENTILHGNNSTKDSDKRKSALLGKHSGKTVTAKHAKLQGKESRATSTKKDSATLQGNENGMTTIKKKRAMLQGKMTVKAKTAKLHGIDSTKTIKSKSAMPHGEDNSRTYKKKSALQGKDSETTTTETKSMLLQGTDRAKTIKTKKPMLHSKGNANIGTAKSAMLKGKGNTKTAKSKSGMVNDKISGKAGEAKSAMLNGKTSGRVIKAKSGMVNGKISGKAVKAKNAMLNGKISGRVIKAKSAILHGKGNAKTGKKKNAMLLGKVSGKTIKTKSAMLHGKGNTKIVKTKSAMFVGKARGKTIKNVFGKTSNLEEKRSTMNPYVKLVGLTQAEIRYHCKGQQ